MTGRFLQLRHGNPCPRLVAGEAPGQREPSARPSSRPVLGRGLPLRLLPLCQPNPVSPCARQATAIHSVRPECVPLVQEPLPIPKHKASAAVASSQHGVHSALWAPLPHSVSPIQATAGRARLIHFHGSRVGNRGPPQATWGSYPLHAGWTWGQMKTWGLGQDYCRCPGSDSSVPTRRALLRTPAASRGAGPAADTQPQVARSASRWGRTRGPSLLTLIPAAPNHAPLSWDALISHAF